MSTQTDRSQQAKANYNTTTDICPFVSQKSTLYECWLWKIHFTDVTCYVWRLDLPRLLFTNYCGCSDGPSGSDWRLDLWRSLHTISTLERRIWASGLQLKELSWFWCCQNLAWKWPPKRFLNWKSKVFVVWKYSIFHQRIKIENLMLILFCILPHSWISA